MCDISTGKARPFVSKDSRFPIFQTIHNLSHPGVDTTIKLVTARFVWPSVRKDCAQWTKACIPCQRAKVQRHTTSPHGHFETPSQRFEHVHLDLVGPLPPSQGCQYALTMIDRFSRWPEVIPITDISAETVARAFTAHWVARFGVPARITTDRGRQFESELFQAMTRIYGITKLRTTAYNPKANGILECIHRPLKAAIRCHQTDRWVDILPIILLGFRAAYRKELKATCAELVYGTSLRLPGEFITPTSTATIEPSTFAAQLRDHMRKLTPVPASNHHTGKFFIHPELDKCTHVFVRRDAVRKPLEPTYDGPYRVRNRTTKHFTLHIAGRSATVSVDRLKPAFLIEDSNIDTNLPPATPEAANPVKTTTRSGRHVHFPRKFVSYDTGGDMWRLTRGREKKGFHRERAKCRPKSVVSASSEVYSR